MDPLPEATQKYFDVCEEKLGMVPNVLQAHALSKLEREMIAVVVSSVNRCFYCLTAHGAAIRALSKDPILGEMIVMNYRSAPLDPPGILPMSPAFST